jgi:hypothetical protein
MRIANVRFALRRCTSNCCQWNGRLHRFGFVSLRWNRDRLWRLIDGRLLTGLRSRWRIAGRFGFARLLRTPPKHCLSHHVSFHGRHVSALNDHQRFYTLRTCVEYLRSMGIMFSRNETLHKRVVEYPITSDPAEASIRTPELDCNTTRSTNKTIARVLCRYRVISAHDRAYIFNVTIGV